MSTLKATTLSNLAGSQTVPMDTVAQGSAKAWVNFNGTGTVAIRRAFNVSSITDNGTGDYTVNFTNAMPDASYAGFASGVSPAVSNAYCVFGGNTAQTSSSVRLLVYQYNGGTFTDHTYNHCGVFS